MPVSKAACLLLGGAVLFSGCYAGAAGIILGALALSDTGGSGNAPSLVGDIAVDGTRASPAGHLLHPVGPRIGPRRRGDLLLPDGGGGTISIASLRALASSPSGTRHRVPWDFAACLGAGYHPGVTISIGVVGGMKASAGPMGIGNDKPEILPPGRSPSGGRRGGDRPDPLDRPRFLR